MTKTSARYLERMENHRNTGWRHEALHLLYHPANLGRMTRYRVRVPVVHRIHLIPGRWIRAACERYDLRHRPLGQWYPPAEPVARVEPPVDFIAPPRMSEAELEDLLRRPHP